MYIKKKNCSLEIYYKKITKKKKTSSNNVLLGFFFFFFFGQVFGLSSNPNNSWGPLLDGLHHRLGNFCLGGHVMWTQECPFNLLKGDKKNI